MVKGKMQKEGMKGETHYFLAINPALSVSHKLLLSFFLLLIFLDRAF
jgi:hypothetical protein